ncbi:olfactory receptor 10A6-like [Menidia menidia]
MTLNQTSPAPFFFILSAYMNVGKLKPVLFLVVLAVYAVIVGSNLLLVVVICVNRSLHEPMYMFLCSLFVNELYGSTGLFPFLLVQILSDLHTVSAPLCFLQVFCIYTYGSVEFSTLAAMSYDRYVAICLPLQYRRLLTPRRAAAILLLVWFSSFGRFLVTLSLTIRLSFCGNVLDSLYCQNFAVVKLSCSDTRVNNAYGIFGIFLSVVAPLGPIAFSYAQILLVCFSGSRNTRRKALSTCTPHLASLINFSSGCLFQMLQSRFDMSRVPNTVRIFLSLYFLSCQPLFNPLLYGLQTARIRRAAYSLLGLGTRDRQGPESS